mgnify:CR=1 FL=1
MKIKPKKQVHGLFSIPGDKSISHRAVILGSLAEGITEIEGFLMSADCLATIECFRQMGILIDIQDEIIRIHGKGLHGLLAPKIPLDVGNSGTTIRLLSGLLSAQPFTSTITGDASIQKRPMRRVVEPLRKMGAHIDGKEYGNFCPLTIKGSPLHGITYSLPVASAQVKSSLLLASLYADTTSTLIEPAKSRNHTEIMINYFGGNVVSKGLTIQSQPTHHGLIAKKVLIPGDISSAAYFLVAGTVLPNSKLYLTNVGINPTRSGILTILKKMGAHIEILHPRTLCGEPVADLVVHSSTLQGTTIGGSIIPTLIDELPILAVAACYAQGTTIIKDASELKIKESNRIATMTQELTKLGAHIQETSDGMIIYGGHPIIGGIVESYKDHRVAMSLAIAGLGSKEGVEIHGSECIDISFPHFYHVLNELSS